MMTRLQSRKLRENQMRPNTECTAKRKVAIFEDKTVDVDSSGTYIRRSYPLGHDSDGCHKVSKKFSKEESSAKQARSLRDRSSNRKVNYTALFKEHHVQKTQTSPEVHKTKTSPDVHMTQISPEVHMESISKASRSDTRKSRSADSYYLKVDSEQEYLLDDCSSPDAMETDGANSLENTKHSIPDNVLDIDVCPDSLSTSIYSQDIMEYLMQKESHELLMPGFLDKSPGVTSKMRGVLMDWLLQVQTYEELKDETLHLCVTFIDTFMSLVDVKMSTLQLIGITCLFIASKFCERFAPRVDSLCYLTQNTFEKEQVIQCERVVLQTLHFNLARPVSVNFLDRYLQVHHNPPQVEYLARYLLDLHITSASLVSLPPSVRASSALYLARFLLLDTAPAWTPDLTFYTYHRVEELQDCTGELIALLVKAPDSKHQGARLKYSTEAFLCISHCDQLKSERMMSKKYA